MKKKYLVIIFLITCCFSLSVQSQDKKPLKPEDYILWKTMDNPQISNDGEWLSYESNPFTGDGSLLIRNNINDKVEIIPRAYSAKFSSNSEFIVFKIKPQEATVRKAKLAKKKKEDLPKDSLGIMLLSNLKVIKYPELKSFLMPENKSGWFAFSIETKAKDKTKEKDVDKKEVDKKEADKKEADKKDVKKNKLKTETLIIAEPKKEKFVTFEKVNDYSVAKDGKWIGYVSNSGDSVNTAEVNIYYTDSEKSLSVFKSAGEAKNSAIDLVSSQIAFIFSQDTTENKVFKLFYASEKQKEAKAIADSTNKIISKGYIVSTEAKLFFSDDNSKLFFGTSPYIKTLPKDTIADDEKVVLDLWTWKDTKPMSQQLIELEKENKRSYQAVYYPLTGQIFQLSDDSIPDIQLMKKNNGRIALGSSELPYDLVSSWEARDSKDYFVIDIQSGEKTKILKKNQFSVYMSPEGRFVAYFNDRDSLWYLYNVNTSTTRILTDKKLSKFYTIDYDNPGDPPPYGIAGWTENDKSVLVYDKYDIWEFDTEGKIKPVNITAGKIPGKNINRYLKLDDDAFCIGANEDILIKYQNDDSMEEGFYVIDHLDRNKFKFLLKDNYKFYNITKSKNSKALIFRRSSYKEFGDLWLSDVGFSKIQKISDVNPQQSKFLWGSNELVNWTFNDKKMKGMLIKPDNFDPKQKYPMITYFYEKTSQTLHSYYGVNPSRSVINFPLYASNGYLIFIPDIEFEIGKPGESGLNVVLSGVYALIEKGFVDQNRLGVQGQSWGGYLVAYIVTHTPVFKAAMAGAPVANMTSAYAAIRKETGVNRINQYEAGQSRIGKTLWERRDLYIENSPLFNADKIETPLLMMANDNDGAVPWAQGIELFLSMRRLQKPAWLLNYNNDEHNISKKPNRIDLSLRMFQFFNHYLKDEPMPLWMKDGIPAKEKGRTLGY